MSYLLSLVAPLHYTSVRAGSRNKKSRRSEEYDKHLLFTEDVRIDPNEGLQEYRVMLQDISRGDVNLFFA